MTVAWIVWRAVHDPYGAELDSGVHAKLSGHSRWAVGRMATLRSALPKGRTCRELLPLPLAVDPRAAVNTELTKARGAQLTLAK